MYQQENLWTQSESLGNVTISGDWDYFASAVSSLRIYLYDFGTIPTWNYLLCGGKPELANPQSWAYTWASVFAYILPSNYTIFALWIVMSAIGFWAMRAFLTMWVKAPIAASAGACIYILNGYFASHFYKGHATFAFFHIVPLILLFYEKTVTNLSLQKSTTTSLILNILIATCFFTAALPHALFYFYPAFLLYVALRFWNLALLDGWKKAAKISVIALSTHFLGIWLALYKLWPIMAWQMIQPRVGVKEEAISIVDVFNNTVHFISSFYDKNLKIPSAYKWGLWEYNAYISYIPWILLTLFVTWIIAQKTFRSFKKKSQSFTPMIVFYSTSLIIIGMMLSLGNGHVLSPFHYLTNLPLIEGIRVFGRYQILIIFGIAILVSVILAIFEKSSRGWSKPTVIILTLIVVLPGIIQFGTLCWNMQAIKHKDLSSNYPIPNKPKPPLYVNQIQGIWTGYTFQNYLLNQGYWVLNCYEPMNITKFNTKYLSMPISDPAPLGVLILNHNSVALQYDSRASSTIKIGISYKDNFKTNAKYLGSTNFIPSFDINAVSDKRLVIIAFDPTLTQGILLSIAGLIVASVFIFCFLKCKKRGHHFNRPPE